MESTTRMQPGVDRRITKYHAFLGALAKVSVKVGGAIGFFPFEVARMVLKRRDGQEETSLNFFHFIKSHAEITQIKNPKVENCITIN